MAVITLKVTEQEKMFMKAMANFEGKNLSELIRQKTLEALEDEYDAKVAKESLAEYQMYLEDGGRVLSWEDSMEKLGLNE